MRCFPYIGKEGSSLYFDRDIPLIFHYALRQQTDKDSE